jgi:hypothetical protein
MLFIAVENQNSAQKARCCQPELLAIADVDKTGGKVIHEKTSKGQVLPWTEKLFVVIFCFFLFLPLLNPVYAALSKDQLQSIASLVCERGERIYIGRRLSMLSMDESVELRAGPLSVTRSLIRILGLAEACDVGGGGGGVRPSLRGGGG